ncbi:MAG: hypothetical protein AABX59_01915 [Nanoarchaeota archaeon]
MPKISQEKIKKIKETILAFLYENFPKTAFTSHIARDIARDEEFTKKLLRELHTENFVVRINKNRRGIEFLRRERWRLSKDIYRAYKTVAK